MIVKLLTEHHFGVQLIGLKGGCTDSSKSTLVKNATLLEISCTVAQIKQFLLHLISNQLVQWNQLKYPCEKSSNIKFLNFC